MNIMSFFPDENATKEELLVEEFKKLLFKLANRGFMNTLQYTYFVDFIKTSGSICNIDLFINQINGLTTEDNVMNRISLFAKFNFIKQIIPGSFKARDF